MSGSSGNYGSEGEGLVSSTTSDVEVLLQLSSLPLSFVNLHFFFFRNNDSVIRTQQ